MKKKLLLLLALPLVVNILFVRMSCGRRTCFDPTGVAIIAFDNADSTPGVPGKDGVRAKAFMLEHTLSGNSYNCDRHTITFERIDSIQLTSDRDFDSLHPAGTDLKDLFMTDHYTARTYPSESQPIKRYLMVNPSDTGTHTFTITFFLIDTNQHTRYLIASTLPVKLLL